MANVDIPRGFVPVSMLDGSPYVASVRHFSTAAGDGTLIGIGDPVELTGASQTVSGIVYPDCARAETADIIAGVCVGVVPETRESTIYRAASTLRILMVETGKDVLFELQEVSGGTALTVAAIGLNADFVVADASTTTGLSGVELNNIGEATTNTLDVKLVGIVPREDNAIGEHCKWLVALNRSQWANQVAGV